MRERTVVERATLLMIGIIIGAVLGWTVAWRQMPRDYIIKPQPAMTSQELREAEPWRGR